MFTCPLAEAALGPHSPRDGEQVLNASKAAAAVLAEHVNCVVVRRLSASHCFCSSFQPDT